VTFILLAAGAGTFDAARSKVQDANAAYQTAVENEAIRMQFHVLETQVTSVQHGVQSIQSLVAKPPPRGASRVQPDISLRVVYPSAFAILLVNDSSVVLKDPKFSPVVWDLDLADRADPLPIPTQTFSGDFIRPHEYAGPMPIVSYPNTASLVKPGHRQFGYIYVTCSDCRHPSPRGIGVPPTRLGNRIRPPRARDPSAA